MLWFATDNAYNTFTADNTTLITDFFNGWFDFHKNK